MTQRDDDLKAAVGCLENCDCAECRERWRQGRSIRSTDYSTAVVTVITLTLGVLALVGLGMWIFR